MPFLQIFSLPSGARARGGPSSSSLLAFASRGTPLADRHGSQKRNGKDAGVRCLSPVAVAMPAGRRRGPPLSSRCPSAPLLLLVVYLCEVGGDDMTRTCGIAAAGAVRVSQSRRASRSESRLVRFLPRQLDGSSLSCLGLNTCYNICLCAYSPRSLSGIPIFVIQIEESISLRISLCSSLSFFFLVLEENTCMHRYY
jgi:hypothetical protein